MPEGREVDRPGMLLGLAMTLPVSIGIPAALMALSAESKNLRSCSTKGEGGMA